MYKGCLERRAYVRKRQAGKTWIGPLQFAVAHCFPVIHSHSNEYSGLISFRMDWFSLHAVQATLKNLLQHHSSKASIQFSVFFIVQHSYLYMTTRKTTALTVQTFVSKVMSLF